MEKLFILWVMVSLTQFKMKRNNMKQYLLIPLTALAFNCLAQKVPHQIVNGAVKITGVDGTNAIIMDNDMFGDSNEGWFMWVKANRKEVNLVGNIATKDGHHQGQSLDYTYSKWMEAYNAANATGMKNIPQPIKGASRNYNGSREENAGSNLIIAEAKKASPQKPLVIFVGGQVSTVANAWLKDNSIGPNIVVFHIDGYGSTDYNAIDRQSAEICINNMRYICWDGDLNGWYEGAGFYGAANAGSRPINRMPGIVYNTPNNPFANLYKSNTSQPYHYYGSIGDTPTSLYFLNNNLWENVVKKNMQNQTVTGDNYNFLLVSKNRWNDYGPMLSNYMNNANNYIPVTTTPPVNNPPTISILTSSTTYPAGSSIIITATASDDKSVAKVEFFNGSVKLGESLTSPYSWVINNATAGTYNLTGKATDNEGASTVSSVRVVTVGEITIPPLPGSNLNTYNVLAYGATGLGGNTDDLAAIQKTVDAATKTSGKVIIPSPINYYKISNTLFIKPVAPESQAYVSIEGNGKYWSQIVYEGPSNNPAVVIVGMKAGSSIKGVAVKLGNGVNNSACYDIGTSTLSTSTSGFSFENCTAELNDGVNNQGWRIGKIDENRGSDISQINWDNVTVFGPFKIVPGQVGFNFAGHNSLGFNVTSSGVVFCETGIKVTSGGAISFVSYLTSQNGTELYMTHSTQVTFTGGRFESSRKFLRVDPSSNFTGVTIIGALISDFKQSNMFDFQGNGNLVLQNVKIESPFDLGANMFTLGGGIGYLSINGGAFNATDPFLTQGGWRAKIENVVKLNKDYQAIGYFTNK